MIDDAANLPEPMHPKKLPPNDGEGSGEVVLLLQPEGILVGGEPEAVESYLDRLRQNAVNVIAVADIDMSSISNAAGVATGAASLLGQAGQFVQLHPQSLEAIRKGNLIPGTDGFFRMMTRDADGNFLQQLQWRPAALDPTQMLSVQMISVQLALKAAIAEVNESIKRVEGKVESVLKLAEAARIGDVLGRYATFERTVRYLEKHQSIPTSYWESVASLGPALDVTIEQLRTHVLRTLRDFDPTLPVQKRAEILGRALNENQIGETLGLLVIAEEALFKWQRVHIARVRATDPDQLQHVMQEARDLLVHQLQQDSILYARAQEVLEDFAKAKPIDGFRYWSVRDLAKDRAKLREDLDSFAKARRHQIAEWKHFETPRVRDAASAAIDMAGTTAGRALSAVGSGLIKFGEYLTEEQPEKEAVRREDPTTSNETDH